MSSCLVCLASWTGGSPDWHAPASGGWQAWHGYHRDFRFPVGGRHCSRRSGGSDLNTKEWARAVE